ncbi:MAG: ribonuclease HII [Actinomycetota bacterium]|nr:ribonuclease HII [Actinomycetota bacterium]
MTSTRLRPSIRSKVPGLAVERELWANGDEIIAGVDEVGRGSWAGPLTVAAAVVPSDQRIYKVRDSKMLNEREREALYQRVAQWCVAWGIGHASPEECDRLGMSAAQRLAAQRAIDGLGVTPDRVLVDGKWDFVGSGNTKMIVGGDATSLTIAAASILAKVTRDRIMREVSPTFPGFDFERNKGYPCPRHRAALAAYGPAPIHRTSWAFMDDLPWSGVDRAQVGGQERLFEGAFR